MAPSVTLSAPAFAVSAPGKVILFGEHAVVYGKRAVAASVDLRTYLFFEPNTGDQIHLSLPDVNVTLMIPCCDIPLFDECANHPNFYETHFSALVADQGLQARAAILAFLYLYSKLAFRSRRLNPGMPTRGFTIRTRSFLPVGAGLGSSASFSTCLAAALLKHFDLLTGPAAARQDLVNEWAFRAEQVIHGHPSGVDNCITTYGGAKLYRKGEGTHDLAGFGGLRFVLVDTCVPKNTKQMVAGVAAFRERYPSVVNPLLDAVDGIAETFQALVATTPAAQLANHPDVARLIGLNHVLLSLLGVSHTALDTIRDVARRHGLAAKMTGGGGGGCALVWIPQGK
ncbi:Mevalonate kinase [Tieghemiomyces parasiticus]|uniref:Mevalonate kinase n=1 Tax=Tieghemiomyces parasiticus TaxID=78921 RepID=A0A9W8A6N6_9FUNG|nr:Mevalonate kinase [Tieghemiomyces parasiticus]